MSAVWRSIARRGLGGILPGLPGQAGLGRNPHAADATARVWEVPRMHGAAPGWLPELAEAIAGQGDINIIVRFETLARLRETLRNTSAPDDVTRWAQWFFDRSATRTLSPLSPITFPAYVNRRIQDDTFASLLEATRLSPANPLAQARFALAELTNAPQSARQVARSDWGSRQALALSPNNSDVVWARAEVCERLGRTAEAWQTMERASLLDSTNRFLECLGPHAGEDQPCG